MTPSILIAILVAVAVLSSAGWWFGRRNQRRVNHDLTPVPVSLKPAHPEQHNVLVIGDSDHPAVTIAPYTPAITDQLELLAIQPSQKQAFAFLTPHMAYLAHAAGAQEPTYIVRFAPEVAGQLSDGSARMMTSMEGGLRATAINSNGTIIGNGTLIEQSSRTLAGFAGIIWGVLAIATAQYYLHSINARLQAIERSVQAIQQRLDDQDLATLVNNMKQLRGYFDALRLGNSTEAELFNYVYQVDTIDRECGRVMETFRLAMQREEQHLKNLSMEGWFTRDAEVATAVGHLKQHTRNARFCWLALQARSTAATLRCALPVDRQATRQRFHAIQSEAEALRQEILSFRELMNERAEQASAGFHIKIWQDESTYAALLRSHNIDAQLELDRPHQQLISALDDATQCLERHLQAQDQGLSLVLALSADGSVQSVKHLTSGASMRA
jgi:hypothetical protein